MIAVFYVVADTQDVKNHVELAKFPNESDAHKHAATLRGQQNVTVESRTESPPKEWA